MTIILIGFKYAGKTSIGEYIATKINKPFYDTDRLTEQHDHTSVHDIYKNKGKQYFRELEKKIILSLNPDHDCIIATGGGSILDEKNTAHLKKQGKIIYLHTSFEILLERLQSSSLPAFLKKEKDPEKTFYLLYQERIQKYKTAADIEIFTDNKSISDISKEILETM